MSSSILIVTFALILVFLLLEIWTIRFVMTIFAAIKTRAFGFSFIVMILFALVKLLPMITQAFSGVFCSIFLYVLVVSSHKQSHFLIIGVFVIACITIL